MPGTVSEVSATLVASTTRRTATCGGEDLVLLGGARAGSRAARPRVALPGRGEGVGGVADLPLAGQEHQDVARPLGGELRTASTIASVWSRTTGLALLVVLGELDERAVADLDRVGAAGDLDDRARRSASRSGRRRWSRR